MIALNSPCAGRKMGPDICQIYPQTSHLTSSILPAKSKIYMLTHECGEHHAVTGTVLFRINCTSNNCHISAYTHRIRHGNFRVWHELDFSFTGEIDVNNSVTIEANLQFLVRPQIIIFFILISLTNNAWKIFETR